jgi:antitoxin VapB
MIAGNWSRSFQSRRYPLTKSAPLVSDRLKSGNYRGWRPLAIWRTVTDVFSICLEVARPEQRHVRLFRNGRNQAVRIPVEFELPGDEAIMYRDGDRLVIEPVRKRGLVALLKTMKPLEEGFPEIDDPAPAPESVF